MNSYLLPPPIGSKAKVHAQSGWLETTVADISQQGTLLLFQGEENEQYAGIDDNGEWHLRDSGERVFFAFIPQVGDELHTVGHDGAVEVWKIQLLHDGHEYVASQLINRQEYTRRFRVSGAEWTCVDDPDEFAKIDYMPVSMPGVFAAKGPHAGDFTTRVLNGASLLYRVQRIQPRNGYATAILSLVGESHGYQLSQQACYTPESGWTWNDSKEPVEFTRWRADEVALKATRLEALRKTLRAKYFHYEAEAIAPAAAMGQTRGEAARVASAICDEIAEELFFIETGLRPDQTWDETQFAEFHEALHDEYLASIEN